MALIASSPQDIPALYGLGMLHYQQGSEERKKVGLTVLRNARKLDSTHPCIAQCYRYAAPDLMCVC